MLYMLHVAVAILSDETVKCFHQSGTERNSPHNLWLLGVLSWTRALYCHIKCCSCFDALS